jgi:hypothetical protein
LDLRARGFTVAGSSWVGFSPGTIPDFPLLFSWQIEKAIKNSKKIFCGIYNNVKFLIKLILEFLDLSENFK